MSLHGLLSASRGQKATKYVFVSGGVMSGLGKGITAASLGVLLIDQGYTVTNISVKLPQIDSGNINPIEHGDVFYAKTD
jgi:CTP synthase